MGYAGTREELEAGVLRPRPVSRARRSSYAKHILLAIEALNQNGTPLPWRLDGDTCSLLEILGLLHHKKYVGLSTEDAEPPRKKASRRRATTALPSVVRSSLF